MPWWVFLLFVIGFALFIVLEAATRHIGGVAGARARASAWLRSRFVMSKAASAGGGVTEAPATPAALQPAQNQNVAPAKPINWQPLLQLGLLLAVILALGAVANGIVDRIIPSGREVAATFRADVNASQNATSQASTQQAQRTTVRVENHAAELARLRREVSDVRQAIANAPDLEARVAAASEFYERMRVEAETTRAAALRSFDSAIVS